MNTSCDVKELMWKLDVFLAESEAEYLVGRETDVEDSRDVRSVHQTFGWSTCSVGQVSLPGEPVLCEEP